MRSVNNICFTSPTNVSDLIKFRLSSYNYVEIADNNVHTNLVSIVTKIIIKFNDINWGCLTMDCWWRQILKHSLLPSLDNNLLKGCVIWNVTNSVSFFNFRICQGSKWKMVEKSVKEEVMEWGVWDVTYFRCKS